MPEGEAEPARTLSEEEVLARTGVSHLSNVRSLSCYAMGLRDVSVLSRLVSCEMISLVGNKVASLEPFSACASLVELFLRRNAVADPAELRHLAGLRWLSTLWLSQNPIAAAPGYRLTVITALPRLKQLDNVPVASGEDGEPAGRHIHQDDGLASESKTGWATEPPPPTPPLMIRWGDADEDDLDEPEALEGAEVLRQPLQTSSKDELTLERLPLNLSADVLPDGEGEPSEPSFVPAGAALGAARALLSLPSSPPKDRDRFSPRAGLLGSPRAPLGAEPRACAPTSPSCADAEPATSGAASAEEADASNCACDDQWGEQREPACESAAQRAAAAGAPEQGVKGQVARGRGAAAGSAESRRPPRSQPRRSSLNAAAGGRSAGGSAQKAARTKRASPRAADGGDKHGRQPQRAVGAEVRAAVLVSGKRVWCAERDGCIVVRDSATCEVSGPTSISGPLASPHIAAAGPRPMRPRPTYRWSSGSCAASTTSSSRLRKSVTRCGQGRRQVPS